MAQRTTPSGNVVLITGSASGIGEATSRLLVERNHRVALVDRDTERLEALVAELGDAAIALPGDVSSENDVVQSVSRTVEHFGRIDGAFLNAAIPGTFQSLTETSAEDFDRVISIDLRGVFLGLREVMRHMVERQGGGSIVATSSLAGLTAGRGLAAYTAAKHGVIGLVRNAAIEGAPVGIRVNCLAPGMTDTPLQAPLQSYHGGGTDEVIRGSIPLGRMGKPREAAELAAFLLSGEAAYLTGAIIPIDGGALADSPIRLP